MGNPLSDIKLKVFVSTQSIRSRDADNILKLDYLRRKTVGILYSF